MLQKCKAKEPDKSEDGEGQENGTGLPLCVALLHNATPPTEKGNGIHVRPLHMGKSHHTAQQNRPSS